jgi:hypothetical protein
VQDVEELAVQLSEHVPAQGYPEDVNAAAACQRLLDLGIEPLTPDRLGRILASASGAFRGALLHRDGRPIATGDIRTVGSLAQCSGQKLAKERSQSNRSVGCSFAPNWLP